MNKLVLTGVVAALFAWTGIETYRYWKARSELAANLQQQQTVEAKLAHLKSVQLAAKRAPTAKP